MNNKKSTGIISKYNNNGNIKYNNNNHNDDNNHNLNNNNFNDNNKSERFTTTSKRSGNFYAASRCFTPDESNKTTINAAAAAVAVNMGYNYDYSRNHNHNSDYYGHYDSKNDDIKRTGIKEVRKQKHNSNSRKPTASDGNREYEKEEGKVDDHVDSYESKRSSTVATTGFCSSSSSSINKGWGVVDTAAAQQRVEISGGHHREKEVIRKPNLHRLSKSPSPHSSSSPSPSPSSPHHSSHHSSHPLKNLNSRRREKQKSQLKELSSTCRHSSQDHHRYDDDSDDDDNRDQHDTSDNDKDDRRKHSSKRKHTSKRHKHHDNHHKRRHHHHHHRHMGDGQNTDDNDSAGSSDSDDSDTASHSDVASQNAAAAADDEDRSRKHHSRRRTSRSHRRNKSRSRSKERSARHRKKQRKSSKKHSSSSSSSSSSLDSDSDSSVSAIRKGKNKRKIKSPSSTISSYQWGKYGTIQECDRFTKRQEFQLWLLEVKDVHPELLATSDEKKLFSEYIEDYNTATLPHEKFYNLDKWEKEKGSQPDFQPAAESNVSTTLLFDDEKQRQKEIGMIRQWRKTEEIRSTYKDMVADSEKIDAMKHQKRLEQQMKSLYRMGHFGEANRIRERLKPDEIR